MIFAINASNMYITIGTIRDGKIVCRCRISTDKSKTSEEYAVLLKSILDIHKVETSLISGAIVASVVPTLNNILKNAVYIICGRMPLVVGPGIKTGLNILLDSPGQMGSDLVITAVAALEKYSLPCVTADMSTATTIGVISNKGNFIGGAICPGLKVSMDGLAATTSQLPSVSLEAPKKVIGRGTVECMQSGLIYGFASMLDGMLERIEEELGERPTVVFTGEMAACLMPHCKREDIILDDNLSLIGLWLIYCRNMKR